MQHVFCLIDFALCAVLVIDIIYFNQLTGSFGFDFMYFVILALIIIYVMMRFYVYNLLITFDLKNFKISAARSSGENFFTAPPPC